MDTTDGHNRHSWWTSWRATTLIQSNLSVSSAVVNLSFSSKSERARESFATSASAKQQPAHYSATIARKISDKNADMDYHAVLPPEYQAWGHSKREKRVSARFWMSQQNNARSIKLRATGSGRSSELRATGCCRRSFKWNERSSSSKYWRRGIHQDVRPSCKEFQAADWGGARIAQIEYRTVYVQDLVNILPIFQIPAQRCDLEPIDERLFHGLHRGLQRITKTAKGWRWTQVSKDTIFDTVCTTTQRRIHHAILAGLDTFRWSRVALLSDPAAKLIRMKVHVFSDSTFCVGVSNPDPSNWRIWEKEHGFAENEFWQPEKCNSFGTYYQVLPFKSRRIFRNTWTGKLQNLSMRGSCPCPCSHRHWMDKYWCFPGLASKNMWWNGRYSERQGKYDIAAMQMTCASGILPTRYFQRQPIFLGGKEEAITICKGTFDNSKQFALYVQTNLAVVWHWKSGTYTKNSGRRRATRSRSRAVDIDFP